MKGGLDGLGKQLLGQAGEAVMGAAKEYIGQVINEMFIVKKEAATKRFLPSIKNMKIVSCRETDESIILHACDLDIPHHYSFSILQL